MTRNQGAAIGLFAAGFVITLGVFALAFWGFGLPWGAALVSGAAAGLYAVFAIWPGERTRLGGHQDSQPDASGSVDQSVTPVGPVTSGIVPGIQGSTGGGVEVDGTEVHRG